MQNKILNVLALGVGGNVGQGILKALNICNIPHRVVGACVSPLSFGLYTTEISYISPYYTDPHFLDWIIEICQREKIDVILTGVEPILLFLSQHSDLIQTKTGAFCLVSSTASLVIAHDKFLTCKWLKSNGLPYPKYALTTENSSVELVRQCGFPLIGKPRFGRGGQGIFKIENEETLQFVLRQTDYLIQEYIGNDNAEFTVGCFSNKNGKVCGTIVMKRELLQGTTYRAEVVDFPEIRDSAIEIVSKLRPLGPCNLQFRLSADGLPVCFEINMRFSGTTPLRARFGFNEVQAALEHYILGKEAINLPSITQGIALRYWNELYVDPQAYQALAQQKKLVNLAEYEHLLENYGSPVCPR